jgi:hypothetical protein
MRQDVCSFENVWLSQVIVTEQICHQLHFHEFQLTVSLIPVASTKKKIVFLFEKPADKDKS